MLDLSEFTPICFLSISIFSGEKILKFEGKRPKISPELFLFCRSCQLLPMCLHIFYIDEIKVCVRILDLNCVFSLMLMVVPEGRGLSLFCLTDFFLRFPFMVWTSGKRFMGTCDNTFTGEYDHLESESNILMLFLTNLKNPLESGAPLLQGVVAVD